MPAAAHLFLFLFLFLFLSLSLFLTHVQRLRKTAAAGPRRWRSKNDWLVEDRQDHRQGKLRYMAGHRPRWLTAEALSGRVRIARHVKTHQLAAVKIVSKSTILNSVSRPGSGNAFFNIEREIVIMKLIDHPNILQPLRRLGNQFRLVPDSGVRRGRRTLRLPLQQRAPVYRGSSGVLPSKSSSQSTTAIVSTSHIGILKPENLLMDRDKNIKIADFGMAAWQAGSNNGLLRTSCGSPHYAAPEVIMGKEYDGRASDIWSCGVILFALLAGHLPFDDEDLTTLLEKVKSGKYDVPLRIDSMAKNLISRMLVNDPEQRITMAEILQHPFFLSQERKVLDQRVPDLNFMARPVPREVDIDQSILANLRTLWHGTPDRDIIESLRNNEPNWQKGVYHLLTENRYRRLENYDEQEEDFFAQARDKRKERRKSEGLPRCTKCASHTREGDFSPSVPPPRAEHTTLSRAGCLLCNKTQPFSPRLFYSPPPPRPTQAPRSDDAMHEFFHQLVERLNAMAIRTGMRAPPLQVTHEFCRCTTAEGRYAKHEHNDRSEPFSPCSKCDIPGDEGVQQGKEFQRRSLPKSDKKKFPMIFHKSHKSDDAVSRRSSLRVKIIEPSPKMLSRRKSLRTSFFSSASSDSSTTLASTSGGWWLSNAFSFKPASYELLSVQNTFTTREECRKLLVGLGIRITLTHAEEAGVLKCKFDWSRRSQGYPPCCQIRRLQGRSAPADHASSFSWLPGSASVHPLKKAPLLVSRRSIIDYEECGNWTCSGLRTSKSRGRQRKRKDL
ncbi:Pkinase-domain-containing protein [Pisolithus orientalis]|uniref:Pkinase-domain-containing protein n=1 Tax=Pisolithus orientalis TaxID=936130 RepID=UPI002224392B|nr:Pkinase-domain-containing protein [Pisolithus orientalis]KAI6010698.1 Pkinase-domain-containing protein [Pisolithus orientalis]